MPRMRRSRSINISAVPADPGATDAASAPKQCSSSTLDMCRFAGILIAYPVSSELLVFSGSGAVAAFIEVPGAHRGDAEFGRDRVDCSLRDAQVNPIVRGEIRADVALVVLFRLIG